MTSEAKISHSGLRHIALNVADVAVSVEFYTTLFGMQVVWQPDPDNAYLSSGCDNLALHKAMPQRDRAGQILDHVGFIVPHSDDVDRAAEILETHGVPIVTPVRTHRDGSRSLYCADPDGTIIQILYEPTLSRQNVT